MTALSRGIVLTVLGLAACGESEPEAYTLTISGSGLRYAAVQDGDGAWQQLTLDANGTATFEVTRGYHSAAASCGGGLSVRRAAPPDQTWEPCGPLTDSVRVSGSVTPATAGVWLENDLWLDGNGTYQLTASAGRRDLVAVDDTHVLLTRDLQLDADRTIDVDVTTGTPLVALTPTVTGNGATPFTAWSEIHTANGTYAQTAVSGFAVVPTAQRVPGDRVAIGARMVDGDVTQSVQRAVLGDATPDLVFEPAPALAIDRAGVRWGEGWDFTAVSYRTALGAAAFFSGHTIVTSDWIAASGATEAPLVDVAALPGWDATWGSLATGTSLTVTAWGGIGEIDGDYRTTFIDATLTW